VIFMRLLSVLALSCWSLTATAELPPLTQELVLEVTVSWPDARKPVLEGRTNLPDGTLLALQLEPEQGDSDDIRVTDGSFRVSLGGDEGLAPGAYSVAVSMLLPMSQPPEVIAIIGADGEHLPGEPITAPLQLNIEATP
jgi:hypothetical protein